MKKFEKVEKTGIISTKFSLRCTLSVILGLLLMWGIPIESLYQQIPAFFTWKSRVLRFQNYRDCGYTCNPHKFEIPSLWFPCRDPAKLVLPTYSCRTNNLTAKVWHQLFWSTPQECLDSVKKILLECLTKLHDCKYLFQFWRASMMWCLGTNFDMLTGFNEFNY